MALRVGKLDALRLAVYQTKSGSLFYNDGGARVRVHGNQKWTTSAGVSMRGQQAPLANVAWADDALALSEDGGTDTDDEERRQIERAIAASLAESVTDNNGADTPEDEPEGNGSEESPPNASEASGDARTCAICLTDPPVMICKPCNHCCACQSCARRLASRPCPLCRRPVRAMERVFFA